MSFQDNLIEFYGSHRQELKAPLEKIINIMLDKCRYINGESLERHNWGNTPVKLKNIPKELDSLTFEKELLEALELDDNEKSIIELLWGDIQLGKRLQACIIMWFSVHICKRPVLYIFRNLRIDQKQLQDDICGTEKYNINIQYIKNVFEECFSELLKYWKDFKLSELQDINSNGVIDKLSNKDALNPTDILSTLMNLNSLEKINKKISEYIGKNNELLNITVLVDESDLMAPSASNDGNNKNDLNDTTACEELLSKIYKKVRYVLHITGTAHSLLYNTTTRLSDNTNIQIKISKVHKMKRGSDYYGLFNNNIYFNTSVVSPWWECKDIESNKKSSSYDIIKDYNENIKKIIHYILYIRPTLNKISKKQNQKYNSLLISEERIKDKHFELADTIMKDFSDLFVIIFHGKCLRLYLSKKYENEIKRLSLWDSKQSSTSNRLHQNGGVYGSPTYTQKSRQLPNGYCYYDIDTKFLNIKLVYKLLRILFEKSVIPVKYKTVITITGKYGERGYSFTSDDYDDFSKHLTDQYFVSHASFNCTDISQRIRLQGKYNDIKNMKLTLWTTPQLKDIMNNFYVPFIKIVESKIMDCESHDEIMYLLENIIDNGEMRFGKYMKYIDSRNKTKNFSIQKHFDKKMNGYSLIKIDDMIEEEIEKWCKEEKLPEYLCINEIKQANISIFDEKYKIKQYYSADYKRDEGIPEDEDEEKKNMYYNLTFKQDHLNKPFGNKLNRYIEEQRISSYISAVNSRTQEVCSKPIRILDYNNSKTHIFKFDRNKYTFQKSPTCISPLYAEQNEKPSYFIDGDNVKYTVIKNEYRRQNTHGYSNENDDYFIENDTLLPEKYYWKTPDGWLYLYDKNKPDIYSINIIAPSQIKNTLTPYLANSGVTLFTTECFKNTEKTNLRIGLKDIYEKYEKWCKKTHKDCLKTQKQFKEELEKLNYKESESKGVDITGKSGKRGYNIMVELLD